VLDNLLAIDNPELECTKNCQGLFGNQDPSNRAIKLLAAACDSKLGCNDFKAGGPRKDSDLISAS
jgi:hypothetical protein